PIHGKAPRMKKVRYRRSRTTKKMDHSGTPQPHGSQCNGPSTATGTARNGSKAGYGGMSCLGSPPFWAPRSNGSNDPSFCQRERRDRIGRIQRTTISPDSSTPEKVVVGVLPKGVLPKNVN